MKLIISPAKKMNVDTDTMEIRGLPRFLDRTRLLCDWLKTMSYDQLKALWRCNDAIASLNYERLQHMELEEGLTPAVLAYGASSTAIWPPTCSPGSSSTI